MMKYHYSDEIFNMATTFREEIAARLHSPLLCYVTQGTLSNFFHAKKLRVRPPFVSTGRRRRRQQAIVRKFSWKPNSKSFCEIVIIIFGWKSSDTTRRTHKSWARTCWTEHRKVRNGKMREIFPTFNWTDDLWSHTMCRVCWGKKSWILFMRHTKMGI